MITGAYDHGRLVELLKRDALRLGDFTLASGKRSHFYVDGRLITLSAEGAELIALGMLDFLTAHSKVAAVGGLTMGADPIVGAILATAGRLRLTKLRGFLVRKEAKAHGTAKRVEGPLEPGSAVAIVDDVATTGMSSLQAIDAVEAMGCHVACVLVVLDRLEGAEAAFKARGVPFHTLTTIRELGVEPLGAVADPIG
jgi:orotate phosphoribosyltransferase